MGDAGVPPADDTDQYVNKVCVWADGPDRDIDDHDGVRQDIARALGAPSGAINVVAAETGTDSVTYTVLIEAPRCDRSALVPEEVPW